MSKVIFLYIHIYQFSKERCHKIFNFQYTTSKVKIITVFQTKLWYFPLIMNLYTKIKNIEKEIYVI